MIKIPTIFERDWEGDRSKVIDKPTKAFYEILVNATPTVKWDGSAVRVLDSILYKRYDCKKKNGKWRNPPIDFIPAQDKDEKSGHWPGWVLADPDKPEDKWFFSIEIPKENGTYEFCGPKINGNPQNFDRHFYLRHGSTPVANLNTIFSFREIKNFLESLDIEGIVWWRHGEPLGKIKRVDFGLEWPID